MLKNNSKLRWEEERREFRASCPSLENRYVMLDKAAASPVGFYLTQVMYWVPIELIEVRDYGVVLFPFVKKARWSFSSQSAVVSIIASYRRSTPAHKTSCLSFALRPFFRKKLSIAYV